MTKQAKTNNLNYLIDPTFSKVNRLFVLSFANEDDRTSFSSYYTFKSWNKRFHCINWWQKLFDVPIKNKEKTFAANIDMNKNNNYTIGNLLDYEYFSKHYKLVISANRLN